MNEEKTFDEKLEKILIGESRKDIRLAFLERRMTISEADEAVINTIAQIKQLIAETIGEDEEGTTEKDGYDAVLKLGPELAPKASKRVRNRLRKELRHAFNLKNN